MGWRKYKKNIMAGLRTMTPIQEEPEDCRTPTPVNGSGDQEVKQNDKALQSGCATPTEGSRSNSRADGLLGAPIETSFSDHLQSLVEDYTKEIISKDRQLRELRQQKQELYVEYWNYKLSWTMDRAEMGELRAQLEAERMERERMKKEYSKLVKKYDDVQNRLDAILKEKNQSQSRSVRSSVEEEDILDSIPIVPQSPPKLDTVPKAPKEPAKSQRRPHTGKSRDVQLPPITENNKVVKSSVAPSRPVSRGSSVHLPSIGPSPSKVTPSPPKGPRPPKSSARSRIPWELPPLRRRS